MGKVRIPGLAADFRVPRSWPAPTDSWLRRNAFWQPPDGWVPIPGLPPAPAGWAFWQPNQQWERSNPELYRRANRWLRAANVLGWAMLAAFAIRIPFALIGNAAMLWPLGVAWVTLAVAALACLIVREVLRVRATRAAMIQVAQLAAAERERRLVREYQQYLRDA